jgi:hypothetical protein
MNSLHPIDVVEGWLAEARHIRQVQLSVYRYHPTSLLDDCDTHNVDVAELRTTYRALAEQITDQEDIAFDSAVTLHGNRDVTRHFALVDFQAADITRVEQVSNLLVAERHPPRAALVQSGRSYHLYLGELLSHNDWVKFMGRILLLNPRDEQPIVDARWVGHRLMAGYSALRWSAKGRPYLPTVTRQW